MKIIIFLAVISITAMIAVTSDHFTNPIGYNGAYTDQSTYIYLAAREYNPYNARFISQDNIHYFNRYDFADDDPINKIDPTGHGAQSYLNGITSVWALSLITFVGSFLPYNYMFYKAVGLGVAAGVTYFLMNNPKFNQISTNPIDDIFKNFLVPALTTGVAYSTNNLMVLEWFNKGWLPILGGANDGLWGSLHSMLPDIYDEKEIDWEHMSGAFTQTFLTGVIITKLGQLRLNSLRGPQRSSISISREKAWSRNQYYSGHRNLSTFSQDIVIPDLSPQIKYTKSRNTITQILDLEEIQPDIDHFLRRERLLDRESLMRRDVNI